MKKILVCVVLSLICGLVFAKGYVVEKNSGTVKYEMSSGAVKNVKKGQTLDEKTYITLGLNSILEVRDENGNVVRVKGPYKGALEDSFRKPGLKKSNSLKSEENDKDVSTSSVRVDLVGIDYVWGDEEEHKYYNVDFVEGITDEEYIHEFCSKSENRDKLVTILTWCKEKPSHENKRSLTEQDLQSYLKSKNVSDEDAQYIAGYLSSTVIGGGSIENFSYQIGDETYHKFFFFEVVE